MPKNFVQPEGVMEKNERLPEDYQPESTMTVDDVQAPIPEKEPAGAVKLDETGGLEKLKTAVRKAATSVRQGDQAEGLSQAERQEQAEIEEIMEEDLGELYRDLPAEKRQELKIVGEQTASRIVILLRAMKIKSASIFNLIKGWLKVIPGVNRFFLNQEAKIKTDKIIEREAAERSQDKAIK